MSAVALQSFGFGEQLVRVVDRAGAAWFVGNDVCAALELSNTSMALARLDDDERSGVSIVDPHGREQQTTVISESGVYSLAFTSRKAAAKQFKRWVTHEVLPTLRQTGEYRMPIAANDRAARVVDLEGALGTADDRHAIKTALLTIQVYKDLYGAQAGRDMLVKLGFPVPGVDLPLAPSVSGAGSAEGDLHAWMAACRIAASRRDATHVRELLASYLAWCSLHGFTPMGPERFRKMLIMLFEHEEHPDMIRVAMARRAA